MGQEGGKEYILKAGKACSKCSIVGYFSRLDLKQRRTKGASPGANTSYNDTLKSANVSRSESLLILLSCLSHFLLENS